VARIIVEHSIRSNLTVVGKIDDTTLPNDCPSEIERMPSEMIDKILDHTFEPCSWGRKSCEIPDLLTANIFTREHSLSWLFRQAATIRARSWPRKPNRPFDQGLLPVEWLQTIQKVRFDFARVNYSNPSDIRPVMEHVADMWEAKNAL
jgi:hypothetical protein